MSAGPVAAIDVGTNTVLMLVARRGADGGLEGLDDVCETPRLGAGLARTGRLDEAAVARTLDALGRCLARARELGVPAGSLRAVGTAALRRASDAGGFLARAQETLGLAIDVLPEEEEARLGYAAVVAGGAGADTLIVDVGGGSTEVVGDGGRLRLSAPVGAVVLTERFLGTEESAPLEPGGFAALREAVRAACERFPAGLARAEGAGQRDLVCLGGTASNLACLELGLPRFDPARAEGARVTADGARAAAERLQALSLDERLALPIEASRAAILPAGLACVAGALERLGAETARVSGRGLRYGVARELLGA
jgi:exopolyphosphatase/guanosine-5'-triphosphate,3'-diphosphate pyrophosphatase